MVLYFVRPRPCSIPDAATLLARGAGAQQLQACWEVVLYFANTGPPDRRHVETHVADAAQMAAAGVRKHQAPAAL